MTRKYALGAVCALVVLTLGTPTPVSAETPPKLLSVKIASLNGSGCPVNTSTAKILDDGRRVGVTYSDFMVSTEGPKQENCQLTLKLATPPGWTIAIQEVTVGGFANIAAGATGKAILSYYFSSESATPNKTFTFTGPRVGIFSGTHTERLTSMNFNPCNGGEKSLNINTRLTVDAGTSTTKSVLYMVSTTVDYNTQITYELSPCE